MKCPLCLTDNTITLTFSDGSQRYCHCCQCDFRFLKPQYFLTAEAEKSRYLLHENDVHDPSYQKFVSPLIEEIQSLFPNSAQGLDFGAGTGPILYETLKAKGYKMNLYDPFFWPQNESLKERYDFIVASEVVEHFYDPAKEFGLLRSLLSSGGVLAIMTLIVSSDLDFENWFYRRDPTHVSFYSEKTLMWLARQCDFSECRVSNPRVAVFRV